MTKILIGVFNVLLYFYLLSGMENFFRLSTWLNVLAIYSIMFYLTIVFANKTSLTKYKNLSLPVAKLFVTFIISLSVNVFFVVFFESVVGMNVIWSEIFALVMAFMYIGSIELMYGLTNGKN